MPNFESVLDKKVEETAKPKPKPAGTYIAAVAGLPAEKTIVVQGVERGILSFSLKLQSPHEGVDTDALADPAIGDVVSWPPFKYDIWYDSPEGEFALRSFLENTLAIDMSGNKTYRQAIGEAPGKMLIATLKHRPYIDKNTNEAAIATDVGGVAKL